MTALDELAEVFAGAAGADYLGEPVTQAEHMYQAAALAEAAQAPTSLIAAALLHDVGHLVGQTVDVSRGVTGTELMAGTDNRHGASGAAWLAQWFPESVTEPVRLHVPAKRYLCTVEPGYFERLSPASVHTLAVQGGRMTPDECADFAAEPFAAEAVAVRRWDDDAKIAGAAVPGFEHYRPLLAGLLS